MALKSTWILYLFLLLLSNLVVWNFFTLCDEEKKAKETTLDDEEKKVKETTLDGTIGNAYNNGNCHILSVSSTPARVVDFLLSFSPPNITMLILHKPCLFRNTKPYPEIPIDKVNFKLEVIEHARDPGPHIRYDVPENLLYDDCIYTTFDDDTVPIETNWTSKIRQLYQPGTILGNGFILEDCFDLTETERNEMDPSIKRLKIFEGFRIVSMDGKTLRKLNSFGTNVIPTICKGSDDLWYSFLADRMGIPVDFSMGVTQSKGVANTENLHKVQSHCKTYVKCATEMLNFIITP
jgi:hypothetical protein